MVAEYPRQSLLGPGGVPKAEPMFRRALEVRERTLGKEHPDTLHSVNGLAKLLSVKGDCAGAEPLIRRALETRERTLGKEHPDTLVSVNNLAWMLYAKATTPGRSRFSAGRWRRASARWARSTPHADKRE